MDVLWRVLGRRSREAVEDEVEAELEFVTEVVARLQHALDGVFGEVGEKIGRQLGAALLSPFVSQRLGFFMSEESSDYIQSIANLIASGEVVAAVDSTRTLEEVPDAIRALVAGDVSGKVVIDVGPRRRRSRDET